MITSYQFPIQFYSMNVADDQCNLIRKMQKGYYSLTNPLVYWLSMQSALDAVLINASVMCFGPKKSGKPWAKLNGWYSIPNAVYSFLINE